MRHLALIAMLVASVACQAEPSPVAHNRAVEPAGERLKGRVIDQAEVLTSAEEQSLAMTSEALERVTGDQLVIVTVPSLQADNLEQLAWAVGGAGQAKLGNSVLMIVAPKEQRVRIAVGKGLDGLLTDVRRAEIVRIMAPEFAAGRPGRAIAFGEARMVAVLRSDTRRPQRKAA